MNPYYLAIDIIGLIIGFFLLLGFIGWTWDRLCAFGNWLGRP